MIEMYDQGDDIIAFRSQYGIPYNLYMYHCYLIKVLGGYMLFDLHDKVKEEIDEI